jgi:DMSO/TMAO reductase YedYZ molybdopterin-dependent catalytic subunit
VEIPSDDPTLGTPVGRRVFLGLVGLAAAAVAAGGPLSSALSRVQGAAAAHDPTGLSGLIPGGGWRYYSITGGFPSMTAAAYRLRVTGLVRQPLTLSLSDIAVRPRATVVRDFQCVTGWRVPNVRWSGVTLGSLIEAAGPLPAATAVLFRSFDGAYTESLTMKQAMRPDVIVADTLGKGAVPSEHGGPVRMLVAPMYGYKSCKWLSEIRLIPKLVPGFWEQNGYDQDGWVGTSNGRDDAPT